MFTLFETKSIAAALLVGGSLFTGLLPKWLGLAVRIEHSLVLSVILCFGAGVLLSTSIIHILHDAVTAMPNWGEIYFCAGFMALYFVDELVQVWCLSAIKSEKEQASHHHNHHQSGSLDGSEEDNLLNSGSGHSKYGSFRNNGVSAKQLKSQGQSSSDQQLSNEASDDKQYESIDKEDDPEWGVRRGGSSRKYSNSSSLTDAFSNKALKAKNRVITNIGLVIAFCTHSLLEGLAVGTQPSASKVVVLLLAVSCHKLVITFCLGAELLSDGRSFGTVFCALSFYAFSSGIGVIIGTVINSTNTAAIPILQALAGGSLLYITAGEILPRERLHKTHCHMPKSTGLIQFFSVLLGIVPIAVMNVLTEENHSV